MDDGLCRRDLLRWMGGAAVATAIGGCSSPEVSVHSSDPATLPSTRHSAGDPAEATSGTTDTISVAGSAPVDAVDAVAARFAGIVPTQWSTSVTGVDTAIATRSPMLALTFDACGGPHGSAVDSEFIERAATTLRSRARPTPDR